MRRILIRFAQQTQSVALIEHSETQQVSELWPEERVLERGAAWAEVLRRHQCPRA